MTWLKMMRMNKAKASLMGLCPKGPKQTRDQINQQRYHGMPEPALQGVTGLQNVVGLPQTHLPFLTGPAPEFMCKVLQRPEIC